MRWGLLGHPDFRRLWLADALSQFGDRINLLAVPLLAALTLRATAWEMSLLRVLETLAFLLLALQVGVWTDRMRKRRVLVLADLGRAVAFGSVPLAAVAGVLTMTHLYVVVAVAGVLSVFFDVAHRTYLPGLVDRDRLVEGNARLQANVSVAAVAAPSLSGWLVQLFGGAAAVGVNAVSFLWSACWLRRIGAPDRVPVARARAPLRREIRDGLRFVGRDPVLRANAAHSVCAGVCQQFQVTVAALFLLREVHLSPGVIGLLQAGGLTGAALGSVVARRLGVRFGEARVMWAAALLWGAGYLMIPLTATGAAVAWYPIGNFLTGLSIVVLNVHQLSYRQAVTPEWLQGRVAATSTFLYFAPGPAGSLLAGVLATTAGLRGTLWLAGAGVAASALWLVCSPLRRMRRLPEAYEEERTGSHRA
ncbi:MFS transporter [Amycolatopsis granulosa]|uniref:MFS transporter n=1 Tax=Amycolatopsis granulosa TaxID=185684 RepID=UPI0014216F44|nr:MFS transporter [Amycolatopsis granulosa]NIH85976.1 MFS family permease [Amycolatopsis granulosa]